MPLDGSPYGPDTNALTGVTTLGYSGLDDLTTAKDQRNNTTTFTYNAFGDVMSAMSPDSGTTSYTHDKAGNTTSRTDARSVVTNYTYDALNRVTFVAYPSDSALNVALSYDLTVGCGTAGIGRLCSLSDASGIVTYEYNDLGQLTDTGETRGALSFAASYTYDLAGNVLTQTQPSGRVITYTRNANGQVSSVSATVSGTGTTLASSIAYLPFGPLSGLTYGNSLTLAAAYDTDYYPTSRAVSSIFTNTYTTDDNGNITQAGTPTYGYDALNRINANNTPSSTSYTYDATSNRLTKVMGGTTTTTVPAASNKISAVGANSYTYDAAGNITGDSTNTYVWNANGQLSQTKVSGTPVGTYTYDYQNRRTKKVAASTTQYVYDTSGQLTGEYDNTGALIKEYVYLNGAPLAQIDAGSPEVLTYLHTDHLGTPIYGTNTSGTQVWAWAPDAFGNAAPTGSRTVNLRMPGQYYDSESGNFYNWNRYYNPAIGRYISSDPAGIAAGMNTFNYALQSPVMYADRLGLDVEDAWEEANEIGFNQIARDQGISLDVARAQAGILPQDPRAAEEVVRDMNSVPVPRATIEGAQCPEITAKNGTTITGYTQHGVDRAIGNGANRAGTNPASIVDALKNPKYVANGVDSQGRPYQIFTGMTARVVVNPTTGQVISVNPLSGAGVR